MSFGFAVGDFLAVGRLAWDVYKACKGAPSSFENISMEVLSLHAVLKEAEESISTRPLSTSREARLKTISNGCTCVLRDLQKLVERYESLGMQSKRTFDRMGWGLEDIGELRSRLTSNVGLLNAFLSTSQATVEKQLETLLREYREGRRENSVVSTRTVESLSLDEKQAWRAIRKELEDVGITVAAFDANKDFIINWFTEAVASGSFQEEAQQKFSRGERLEESVDDVISRDPKPSVLQSTGSAVSGPTTDKPRKVRISRVNALLAVLSRPQDKLMPALENGDVRKVQRILEDDAKALLLSHHLLNDALLVASLSHNGNERIVQLLLEKGADANARHEFYGNVLQTASVRGNEQIVQLLLEKGADVNAQGGYYDNALQAASVRGHEQTVQLLLEKGADINAQGGFYDNALKAASVRGNEQIVQLLLEKKADVNAQGGFYDNALQAASVCGNEHIVQLLLEKGADVNTCGGYYGNALQAASFYGNEQIVQLLLETGFDVNTQGGYYSNALQAASFYGNEHIVQLLLEMGADVNAQGGYYGNALQAARAGGHKQVIRLLKNIGAEVDAQARI